MKNLDQFSNMKNMLNVSLIDILIPQIKSNQNENVIKMLDIVKDKPDAYLNLLSVAIFHKNLKIVELILDKYFTSDIEEPYINSHFLYNSILPENSKYKLTDTKNNYNEEICPYAVMAGIGGDIEVFKCLYKKKLINNYNINYSGIIGLTKKYKNAFFSNIIGACAYYGNDKLLEYILTNYRAVLDININTTEKKAKNSTKFHFSKEFSDFTPAFLGVGGHSSDKKSLEILKILEEYRANFESKDFNENNIIHIATKEKKIMCLKFLVESLELKTIMNENNLNNETPYILAQQSKNKDIINFFDSYNTEDDNIIKQNLDELIKEDNKKKNKKLNKKQKKKKENITLLHSSEYEETLGFNQDKQEDEQNNNDNKNDNNEEIEEENYNEDKIEEENEEVKEETYEQNTNDKNYYNNKKYKNKKDYYGKKYYDDNDKYDSYKKYDDYKYDNNYIKYNSGNNLYYNKKSSIYNNDTFKKSKSNYNNYNKISNDYNNKYTKGKYYNDKNDYYNYKTKGNRESKKELRGKYNDNNKNWSNKDDYYNNKRLKAIAVEINEKDNNNNYISNDNKEENNTNYIDEEQSKNNIDNYKPENKKNTETNENNILSKEKENEDENLEEEEEDDYSYSEEDFLTQSDKKDEKDKKEEKVLNLSLSEYNGLYKKCSEAERRVNILEKEKFELSKYIQKLYIENNHKIEQKIPNEESNINSLLVLTNEELDKKDKLINKLKNEAKMADLSNIKNMQKEQLKEYKNLYNKNLKIINDALKQYE